jgi:23S rRNA (pseudouridine1915-N3)-methyltransferase
LRVTLLCIGKLGIAVEARLALDYAARATTAGRALGFGPVEILEVEARKGGKAAEGSVLLDRIAGDHLIACDEHGTARTSRDFSARLARLRDDGVRRVVLVIGGADGLDEKVLVAAHERLAFGPQTWPHALARAMLAEQIYRAVTIMAGTPYHRD